MEEERVNNERHSRTHHGSVPGHAVIDRDRVQGHQRLYRDYFANDPVYPTNIFCRRFRMSHLLFLHIQSAVEAYDRYFVQKRDVCGVVGLSSLQKIKAALRMLAYGVSTDAVDDYMRMGETTAIEALKRSPNENDIAKVLEIGERVRRFPGMLGRSLNDLNMLERSFVFSNLAQGRTPLVNYSINGHNYTMRYYLTDGIYLQWSTFVKIIPSLKGNKNKMFAKAQESARKDVERAFRDIDTLKDIMQACVILYNMIIEDERDVDGVDNNYDTIDESPSISVLSGPTIEFSEFIQQTQHIREIGKCILNSKRT
ncbi:hypothetical protein L1049_007885 [Liquidambar formosana]|uniref:Uncharacterized protein n=1 Tax=Liquidambar formosana TaxID=63359 RepID=A0AAP0S8Z7_LIQFO